MTEGHLQKTIDEGIMLLGNDPKGELPKSFRVKLWSLIGPRLPDQSAVPEKDSPSVIRYELGRSCLTKILPFWEGAFAEDRTPHELRDTADKALFDKSRIQQSRQVYDKGWVYADNLAGQLWDTNREIQHVAGVCYCACRLIDVALADERFNEFDLEDPVYLEFDPYLEDPAFYASAVYSKGFQSKTLNVEFWTWYLRTAVPGAFCTEPS